jgi:hypothetical protein
MASVTTSAVDTPTTQYAAPARSAVDSGGNNSPARSGEMISALMPLALAADACRRSSSSRASLSARCTVPVSSNPVAYPVSAGSDLNTSRLRRTTSRGAVGGPALGDQAGPCALLPFTETFP